MSGQHDASREKIRLITAAMFCLVCALISGCWGKDEETATDGTDGPGLVNPINRLPELPESRFLNTRDATYTGDQACLECHQDEHAGFLHTGMGRSMSVVVPRDEPADTQFDHPPSGRRYQVVRRDGKMFHRELKITAAGEPEVLLAEYPVPYVVGSGRHAKTYVVQIDGFMFESPLTWYRNIDGWDMSPGYDHPLQEGFKRPVDQGCLVCHAGQSHSLAGSVHRMQVNELTISCERCHGPGSLHVAKRTTESSSGSGKDDGVDYTIVNPRFLERDLADSICAQCHLGSSAIIQERGRALADFRPGLPLDAFRNGYRLEKPSSEMTVVGHVDQLRLSKCYQASEMSCVSCHDPHNFPGEEERLEYYRAKCVSCHQTQVCSVDEESLRTTQPNNDCVACHMPKSATDLPHMNFHHHRIGLHSEKPTAPQGSSVPGKLVPLFASAQHSDVDLKRSLGIAYIALSQREEGREHGMHYVNEGTRLLEESWQSGLRDPEMAKNLAEVSLMRRRLDEVQPYLEYLLAEKAIDGKYRVSALLIATTLALQKQDFPEAVRRMREVTQLRYVADDWENLAQYELLAGNREGCIEALKKALKLDPTREHLRRLLDAQLGEEPQ